MVLFLPYYFTSSNLKNKHRTHAEYFTILIEVSAATAQKQIKWNNWLAPHCG